MKFTARPQTPTKELIVPVTYSSPAITEYGCFPTAPLAAAANKGLIFFQAPHDFNGLLSAIILVIPSVTQALANWDLASEYGSIGQAFNTHSESEAALTYDVTQDQLFEVDIACILTALVAGDKVGVKLTLADALHDVRVVGIIFRYN